MVARGRGLGGVTAVGRMAGRRGGCRQGLGWGDGAGERKPWDKRRKDELAGAPASHLVSKHAACHCPPARRTSIGPRGDMVGYLRPETAQVGMLGGTCVQQATIRAQRQVANAGGCKPTCCNSHAIYSVLLCALAPLPSPPTAGHLCELQGPAVLQRLQAAFRGGPGKVA